MQQRRGLEAAMLPEQVQLSFLSLASAEEQLRHLGLETLEKERVWKLHLQYWLKIFKNIFFGVTHALDHTGVGGKLVDCV